MVSAYFLLVIPFFTVVFIDYYYDLLIVTDRRLLDIDQNSLFSRNVSELALEQVEDVSSPTAGILQTIFDFGDVVVQTAGAKEKFTFKGVYHPRQITEIILDLADQAKQRIERGPRHLMPSGPVKAVIEGREYKSVEPLYKLGVVIRPRTVTTRGATPNPVVTTPPARPAGPIIPPDDDLDIVIDDIS